MSALHSKTTMNEIAYLTAEIVKESIKELWLGKTKIAFKKHR